MIGRAGTWALPLLALGACLTAPTLDEHRLVDLSHAYGATTLGEPGEALLEIVHDARRREDGRWRVSGTLSGPERAGTYASAPMAFSEGRHSIDEIPLSRLVAPIRVLDVERTCTKDREHRVDLADLREHEKIHGRIPARAAVLIRTGWSRHWGNTERYLGGTDEFRFPSLSVELARELVARRVDVVGIDTAGLDAAGENSAPVRRILADGNVPGLVNLMLPPNFPLVGATLLALPMKIERGGASPTRVVAIVP